MLKKTIYLSLFSLIKIDTNSNKAINKAPKKVIKKNNLVKSYYEKNKYITKVSSIQRPLES